MYPDKLSALVVETAEPLRELSGRCLRTAKRVIASAIIGLCIGTAGCQPQTSWSSPEVKSPDGTWLVYARTVQNSGFGTGAVVTDVYLKRTASMASPAVILSLTHDYGLASQSGATIHLTMNWLSPSTLQLSYDGRADVGLEVVRLSNVTILVHDQSRNP